MDTISVGYVVGSLSRASINRQLAALMVDRAPAGITMRELAIGDLTVYNHDLDKQFPEESVRFQKAVESTDAILFVTPEYNRSIPGALKNAIDWGSRPWGQNSWAGKRAAIIGTGLNGAGTAVAQAQLRGILGYLGMTLLATPELCVPWTEGVLQSPPTLEFIDAYWAAFAAGIGPAGIR